MPNPADRPPVSKRVPLSHLVSFAALSQPAAMPADGDDLERPLMGEREGQDVGWSALTKNWLFLGWTAFGGPAAHIGFFQKTFVQRLRWLTTGVFVELLALGQCLPGPTSTQMAFAIGVAKKGTLGGLTSGFLFLYPGLILMSLVGLGAANFLKDPSPAVQAVVAGLAVTGVALVASAAKQLVGSVCKTRPLALVCAASAAAAYYHNTAWLFPVLLLGGAIVTVVLSYVLPPASGGAAGDSHEQEERLVERFGLSRMSGGLLIAAWAAVLVAATVLSRMYTYEQAAPLHWFELFYRTGSLIFGGGQVVLPLLLGDMTGGAAPWMSESDFYAGLAAAQAMPGPLFNFSAYLGAVVAERTGYSPALGIALCWLGLFGPGIMLIFGVLPFWSSFRHWDLYRKALPGLNSAAVGLIVSAVVSMAFGVTSASSPFPKAAVAIGIIGFAAVDVVDVPAPLAVLGGGALGLAAHALNMQ